MSKDKVLSFSRLVAGKAGFYHRLPDRFTVVELSKPPASRRGIFFCVLDHKLNPVLGWAGHKRLLSAKGLVVFLRRVIAPGEPGDDCSVWERNLPFSIGLDRYVVTQNGP